MSDGIGSQGATPMLLRQGRCLAVLLPMVLVLALSVIAYQGESSL